MTPPLLAPTSTFKQTEYLLFRDGPRDANGKAIDVTSAGLGLRNPDFENPQSQTSKDNLYLIDEALTPDSSRFWPVDTYRVGTSPESFDKQYIRNWLESVGFNKEPPAPPIPPEVARQTSERYREALTRLVAV